MLIKNYVKNLKKEDILKYSNKENIILTNNELNIIYDSIKNDIDIILSKEFYNYLSTKKHLLTEDVYKKIIELSKKYEYFILE